MYAVVLHVLLLCEVIFYAAAAGIHLFYTVTTSYTVSTTAMTLDAASATTMALHTAIATEAPLHTVAAAAAALYTVAACAVALHTVAATTRALSIGHRFVHDTHSHVNGVRNLGAQQLRLCIWRTCRGYIEDTGPKSEGNGKGAP